MNPGGGGAVGAPALPCSGKATATLVVTVKNSEDPSLVGGVKVTIRAGSTARSGYTGTSGAKLGQVSFRGIPPSPPNYEVSGVKDGVKTDTQSNVAVPCAPPAKADLKLPGPVNPLITPDEAVVAVRKPYVPGAPVRTKITLKTDKPFDGNGTLKSSSGAVRFFSAAAGGIEIKPDGKANVFPGAKLTAGVDLFAEGAHPSKNLKDITLTLGLKGGTKTVGKPAEAKLTSVAVTLDICMSRSKAGHDPSPLPQPPDEPPKGSPADKFYGGRYIHLQDAHKHHGRAMLIIRKAQPADFAGDLVLTPLNAKVNLFAADSGGVARATPYSIGNAAVAKVGDTWWVEGAAVSGALRDTGFKLGIKTLGDDLDRATVTVVQFTEVKADVPCTPANTNQMANSPVARHDFTRTGDVDPDFTTSAPLVLIQNSLTDADPVVLTTVVKPAGVPILWSVLRDTRAAPDGDSAEVIKVSPRATPTLQQDAKTPTRATLRADSAGSFHVRPFVDCNTNGKYDEGIDREPYGLMNLVLIHVRGDTNSSVAQPGNLTLNPNPPTAAGFTIATGSQPSPWTNAALQGVHSDAQAIVIGGGGDGKRGLDQLFAGWVNNLAAAEIVSRFATPAGVAHRHAAVFVTNNPGGPGNIGFFIPAAAAVPAGLTTSNAAPAATGMPLLDTTNFANPGTGGNLAVGTEEGAPGPPTPIVKTDRPTVGQTWQVEMWDSPGFGAQANYLFDPTAVLRGFRYNLDFRCDLCFWTNVNRVPGATADAANRLYASVQTDGWRIRYEVSFNAAGNLSVVTAYAITRTNDRKPTRLAKPVDGARLEVRFPIVLNVVAIDASV